MSKPLSQIYSEHARILGVSESENDEKTKILEQQESAARQQITHQWLQSTVTQEMFHNLNAECERLIDNSIGLSYNNWREDNSKLIVSNLIRVNEIRNIIKNYGRTAN